MSQAIPKFEARHSLQEHRSGVNIVKISPDGSMLLSGAQDGTVIVWDLRTGRALQTFNLAASHEITAAVWCPFFAKQPVEAFAIGAAFGNVTIYRKGAINYDYANAVRPFLGPVEDMAYDPTHKRLAMVGSGCLKLFDLSAAYTTSFLHGTPPREHAARSTAFYAGGSCVFVCYLQSRHITGYAISPWAVRFDGDLETRIGCAAYADGGDLYISNLMNGMDIYSFPPTPIPIRSVRFYIDRNFPLRIAVSPAAGFAVVGGEDGHARVYDIQRGVVDAMLPHGNQTSLIQQVDVHASPGKCIIVTGCSEEGNGTLKVWFPHIPAHASTPISASSFWIHSWRPGGVIVLISIVFLTIAASIAASQQLTLLFSRIVETLLSDVD